VATEPQQRAYRSACPGCGAPVTFASLASTHAVCGFCQSTIVREGDALRRIGKMAEVFDDYSALQLMAQGKLDSVNFTVVGRLQYKYEGGSWNEWLVALDDGTSASLSEDNGSFVWTRAQTNTRDLPKPEQWIVGNTTAINGKQFSVASVQEVALMAAQGELPKLPPLGQKFYVVELRSAEAEVLSVDYSTTPASLALGRAVDLDALQLTGLRDLANATGQGGKEVAARQFNCPNCGSPVDVKLAGSKSITCGSCNSLIDLTQGIGGDLKHAEQDEPVKPLIALGSIGTLQGKQWQIVGYQHRMGHEIGDEDESFGWGEYLLFNAKAGFIFLVDSTDGWSIVKPATGAPTKRGTNAFAYLGTNYTLQYSYKAETSYVAGEFYWQVKQGQITFNEDYASGKSLLSSEKAGKELTWSVGSKVDHTTVATAFKIKDRSADFQRADVTPFAASGVGSLGVVGWIIIVMVIVILLSVMSRCSSGSCDPQYENCSSSSRSSGGSYGGSSSGGGHK
jgi:ribosomal protein S27E